MKISKKKVLRLVLIWVIPIIIFLLVFIPFYDSIRRVGGTNEWIYTVEESPPTLLSSIKDLFETPLDLKWYKFCFESGNTTFSVVYLNKSITYIDQDPKIRINLLLPNGEWQKQKMERYSRYCTKVNLKHDFMYSWIFESSYEINETTKGSAVDLRLNSDWKVDKFPESYSLLTKLILTFLSWWAILWIITRMIYFYRHGIPK